MGQRLVERNVRVAVLHVLADHGEIDLCGRVGLGLDHGLPSRQVGGLGLGFEAQFLHHDLIEPLLVQQHGDFIDIPGIDGRDDRALLDVGEQGDLAPVLSGQRVMRTAKQDIRLDADAAQLLHRVLRRFGLDLAAATHHGHQRQVHEDGLTATEFDTDLTDRLEERQRLNVTDGAADLHHAHIRVPGAAHDARLDLIGDVRDHLHRGAEVIAATLLGNHALIDAPSREVAVTPSDRAHEALVVAEVEIRFRAIVGDEHFTMLERTHGARIHVDVRVELDHGDLQATCLEDRGQ